MLKCFASGVLTLALLSAPVLAQSSCDPAALAAAIDRYAAEPFGARTWRMLQGLGDPMLDPQRPGDDQASQLERWRKLAAEILPASGEVQNVSWNCRIGYPLSVLEARIAALGKEHPYVKQWLLMQEQVMRACTSDSGAIELPPPLEAGPVFADLQRADRIYQQASIAFYRDKEKAIPLFRAIAQSGSPHRAVAAYNIANLLANARKPAEARKEAEAILADPSMQPVHAITRELLGFIANQEDTAEGWTGVIERDVAILETPADKILASADLREEYARALYDIDFAGVRGKDGDWWLDGTLPEGATISKALVDASRTHAMVLWMMAGQSANERYERLPWSLIGQKWQDRMTAYIAKAKAVQPAGMQIRGPALDMLEALAAAPDDASRAALWTKARAAIEAATRSCGTAPDTASAGFLLAQATRLSALAGNHEEAYRELDAVPFKAASAYTNGALLRLAQHLVGQGDAAEARVLRDRLVQPDMVARLDPQTHGAERSAYAGFLALVAEDEAKWKDALRLTGDPAASILFNLLPTAKLWSFASEPDFPEPERALFARAAWTRDYALRRQSINSSQEQLFALNPAIREIADRTRAAYPKAQPIYARLLTILRSPRHNILVAVPSEWDVQSLKPESFTAIDAWDHNDKNWWCPLEIDRQLGALRDQADAVTGVPAADGRLVERFADVYDEAQRALVDRNRDAILKAHPMVKAIDWNEVNALARIASGPRRLTEAAIEWGKRSAGDDGAPEALALAVRTTRYGCNWHGGHGKYSAAAQQLLKAKFYETEWARQTPYWFDCMRQTSDKDGNRIMTCEQAKWPKQEPLR
jgi:hypothetical protein